MVEGVDALEPRPLVVVPDSAVNEAVSASARRLATPGPTTPPAAADPGSDRTYRRLKRRTQRQYARNELENARRAGRRAASQEELDRSSERLATRRNNVGRHLLTAGLMFVCAVGFFLVVAVARVALGATIFPGWPLGALPLGGLATALSGALLWLWRRTRI